MGRCIMANGYEATGTGIGFPISLPSGIKNIPSEAEVMQEYYANIGRPGSGATGGDYLSTIGGILPTLQEQINSGTLTVDASGALGPEFIDDTVVSADGTTTYSTYTGPNARRQLLEDEGIDTTGMSAQEIAQALQTLLRQSQNTSGISSIASTNNVVPTNNIINEEIIDDPYAGLSDDPYGYSRDNDINLIDYLKQIPIAVRQGIFNRMSEEQKQDLLNNPAVSNEIKKEINSDYNGNGDPTVSDGTITSPSVDIPTRDFSQIDLSGAVDGGGDGEGFGSRIKDMLSGAYDKMGMGGVLTLLGLLGAGGASSGSGAQAGGIGSFVPGQRDPLGSTADYANMPGGGVGQPTYLNPTQAPIYYPFASEVTKQYNAQSPEPFSFTRGPAPEAMIQNLDYQQVPGVQYVADGAFMRRNGLTEGPGTETSDDIPAMLSDGEFVTNAEANRGIGAMALLNQGMPQEVAMNPEQQRLAGARQMYLQQAMGQQLAQQMRDG